MTFRQEDIGSLLVAQRGDRIEWDVPREGTPPDVFRATVVRVHEVTGELTLTDFVPDVDPEIPVRQMPASTKHRVISR